MSNLAGPNWRIGGAKMTVATRRFTIDDLENFPEDGSRYEVIDGELHVSTAPDVEHQFVISEFDRSLGNWSTETGLGLLVPGAGLIFSRHDGVIPDLMWYGAEQLPRALINPATGERVGRFFVAPYLAIEVLSPGKVNEDRDRETKLTLYSRRGVREYWIVDRFTRTVLVYRRTAAAELDLAATLTDRDMLTSPLLPGFAVVVERVFRLPMGL
jgi:Uma2 family endonuclease